MVMVNSIYIITDILRYHKLNLILRRHSGFIMTASWKIILSVLGGVAKRRSPIRNMLTSNAVIVNLLLTEREGRTGEYWPEVVAVRIERSEVSTETTEGQYSPVRLEQTRLVSSLLYGTRGKLVYFKKRVSGHLYSKGFRRDVFLMTQATQKEQATVPRG